MKFLSRAMFLSLIYIPIALLCAFPAHAVETPTTYSGLVDFFLTDFISGIIVPGIFTILFIFVMWKIFDAWVLHADDDKKRSEGRQLLLIAIIGFVIMVSVWGIINLLTATFFGF